MMYAFAKKVGIDASPCIGECKQEGYKPFDHSWLLIDENINDIAIAMPFELSMAKGPVYDSIDIRTGKRIEMDYGIKFLGLGQQAQFAYSMNLYEYLKGSPEVNLINAVIELSKISKVYITRKWMEQNLSSDRFVLFVLILENGTISRGIWAFRRSINIGIPHSPTNTAPLVRYS